MRVKERTVAIPGIVRCKRPSCKNEAVARGLCRSDYASAWKLVDEGIITWEELQQKGKIDPKCPSAKDWFLA